MPQGLHLVRLLGQWSPRLAQLMLWGTARVGGGVCPLQDWHQAPGTAVDPPPPSFGRRVGPAGLEPAMNLVMQASLSWPGQGSQRL